MPIQSKVLSSLEKVFLDEESSALTFSSGSALCGEIYSFQIAYRLMEVEHIKVCAKVTSKLSDATNLYEVHQVPVTLPCFNNFDDNYLRTTPGLYPDLLFPHTGEMSLVRDQWRCLWVSINIPKDFAAGEYPITIHLYDSYNPEQVLVEETFNLSVIGVVLPKQKLLHTDWFHCDCIATYYKVPVFSEEHWTLINNYMANASLFGMNLILTPVFTPPLDTKIGGERPTVQLVDVNITNGQYMFGFERLGRYIRLAKKNGIDNIEISHLFTQWGAQHAPKIIATVNGETKQIFGWETDACSDEYSNFLRCFLTDLHAFLKENDWLNCCYFHVSDEPHIDMLENYSKASKIVAETIPDCPVIDALSDYEFYENGIIRKPIPANNCVESFIEHGVQNLWTYYCCGQGNEVSNRFIAMPSARNRILGYQLYKYRMEGFLQWGYNFWYSQHSIHEICPFIDTSASDAFPAGDAFIVYPGANGKPMPSIRQIVFNEALQDLRAAQLLESFMSFDEVLSVLEEKQTITFKKYPKTAEWMLNKREKINQLIKQKADKF